MRLILTLREFLALESAGGILLALAAAAALALANSPLAFLYDAFLDTPVEVRVASLQIAKPLLLWINDGLMAVFFFLVGLEIKREVLEGELSDRRQIVLPAVAAICGMAAPALIYAMINAGDPIAQAGWAIPAATDIAFALGVLSLLGSRVTTSAATDNDLDQFLRRLLSLARRSPQISKSHHCEVHERAHVR